MASEMKRADKTLTELPSKLKEFEFIGQMRAEDLLDRLEGGRQSPDDPKARRRKAVR